MRCIDAVAQDERGSVESRADTPPCPATPRVLPPVQLLYRHCYLWRWRWSAPGNGVPCHPIGEIGGGLGLRSMRTAHDLKGVRGRSVRIIEGFQSGLETGDGGTVSNGQGPRAVERGV